MIVDLDTRLWSRLEDLGSELAAKIRRTAAQRWVKPDASLEMHTAAMGAVDAAVVVGFRSALLRASISESFLKDAVAQGAGRLFLARAIDPTQPNALDDVESARAEGAHLLWTDPMLQGYHPASTAAMRVFDRAEALQLPIVTGFSGAMPSSAKLEFGRPYLLDEVARSFPRLALVIGGLGAPFVEETLTMLAKHDRVFTHVAGIAARPWQLLNALEICRDLGVESKVLFASGFPFDTPARAIEAVYSVNGWVHATALPHIARSALREIVERDSISLLGIGVPPPPSRDRARLPAVESPRLRISGETA
ncbi:MAG: hypothetical protein EXS10_02140 [Phycisphaerales bacterium]|nr:hypothetical protein [Phycisphaerales bacterium]